MAALCATQRPCTTRTFRLALPSRPLYSQRSVRSARPRTPTLVRMSASAASSGGADERYRKLEATQVRSMMLGRDVCAVPWCRRQPCFRSRYAVLSQLLYALGRCSACQRSRTCRRPPSGTKMTSRSAYGDDQWADRSASAHVARSISLHPASLMVSHSQEHVQ